VREVRDTCLRILGVMKDRPPPGGPIAVNKIVLIIFLKGFSLSLCSYHPPWSKNWRISSIGGCAPYFYFVGIFRSSTNKIHFPCGLGPYYPLRILSNLPSIISWVIMEEVWAEKPNYTDMYLSAGNSFKI